MKTSFLSKINWTQVVAIVASLITIFFPEVYPSYLDATAQVLIVFAIQTVQALVTWILRTWFTTEITKASAKRASWSGAVREDAQ